MFVCLFSHFMLTGSFRVPLITLSFTFVPSPSASSLSISVDSVVRTGGKKKRNPQTDDVLRRCFALRIGDEGRIEVVSLTILLNRTRQYTDADGEVIHLTSLCEHERERLLGDNERRDARHRGRPCTAVLEFSHVQPKLFVLDEKFLIQVVHHHQLWWSQELSPFQFIEFHLHLFFCFVFFFVVGVFLFVCLFSGRETKPGRRER